MKLYRAVPVTMFCANYHDKPHSEDVYFCNNLITINHKSVLEWKDNNDYACYANQNGKYFFFFPEHAIALGSDIYYNEYLLKLIEYEVPEDLAFVLSGCGYYRAGNKMRNFPETIIYYKNLSKDVLNSQSISYIDKTAMLKNSLIETFLRLQSIKSYSEYHGMCFEEFFIKLCQNDNNPLFGLNFLNQFLTEDINLIPATNINQRSWTINNDVQMARAYSTKNPIYEENKYYLNENGLYLQLSNEAENARISFNVNGIMGCNINLAKKLLREYHKQFPN